uniref:Reverse transcriptase domain-containing protein n=1 Tax=Nothobranchius furzeri TaxID=105023 RepID=A0A8C6MEW6_NOTFU
MANSAVKTLKRFEVTEYNTLDYENNIDPDGNLLNTINDNCKYYTNDQFNSSVDLGHFSLIHINCRSLYVSFDQINAYMKTFKHQFEVIALSETWLNEEKGTDFDMVGYHLFYTNRGKKKGGGVALYVKSALKCKILDSMAVAVEDMMECVAVEIEMEKTRNIIVACIYRTPGSNLQCFKERCETLIDGLNDNKSWLICGDFNIDLLNQRNKMTRDFMDVMSSRSLYPVITQPTRITSTCATLIDNIYTNEIEKTANSGLLISDISDHLPIFIIHKNAFKKPKELDQIKHVRIRTEDAITAFCNDLLKENWSGVYVKDVNVAYDTFLKTYKSLYNKNCPVVVCRKKINMNVEPWLTKGLLKSCKRKNKLYRDFVRYRTKATEMKYKIYKNKLTSLIRQAKKDHYNLRLKESIGDMKRTWRILNSVIRSRSQHARYPDFFTNGDKILRDKAEVVNELNSFFVNIGPSLAKSLETQTNEAGKIQGGSKILQSMFLGDVSENEVLTIVRKSKNKTSTDCDGIDMMIVKKTIDYVVKPFTYICNLSVQSGTFPEKMKTAKVIPIFKNGDRHKFDNYRPISVLSQFSKVLEKWFVQKLDNFIEKENLLSESQYGFRSHKSTSLALLELNEELSSAIEKKQYTVGLFIDLKKAFDTIDHSILLSKLRDYGIRGIAHDWLSSYLTNRNQFVQLDDEISDSLEITHGVPQGSVLGPKLFILYINDICDVSKVLQFILFADDTNIFCSGNDLEIIIQNMVCEMSKLKKWFNDNKLFLNWNKTKFMVFGNRKTNDLVTLSIDGFLIDRVNEVRFLGVLLDHKLTWKSHIKYIKQKISKSIGILNKVKGFLEISTLQTLYYSFILPYLTYCIEVWGNTYKTNTNPLFLLQKKVLRILYKANPREHTNKYFVLSKIMKFKDLVNLKILLIMFKARNNLLPTNLQRFFVLIPKNDKSRKKPEFKRIFVRTTLKQMCISIYGVKLWNNLDDELKKCTTTDQFKKMYKDKMLKSYDLVS